jgi:hypothetical protein
MNSETWWIQEEIPMLLKDITQQVHETSRADGTSRRMRWEVQRML